MACRSAQLMCAGSPAMIGPVLTKKVACMPCADRIGKPLSNWSTVPSSNPSVTTTGLLAAAGGVDIAQNDSGVMSAPAAATEIRMRGRACRLGRIFHSSFIGLPFSVGGLGQPGHLAGEGERRRRGEIHGRLGVRERLHVVLPFGVVPVELCERVQAVGWAEVHAGHEPARG